MAKKDRKSQRFEIEDTMSAADIAGYLEGIAKGLREGTVALGEQGESFQASVTGDVEFEVEARHGKRKSHIELSLSFRRDRRAERGDHDESAEQEDKEVADAATIPDEMSF